MLSYRLCFYAIRSAPWVLGLGWMLNMLLYPRQSCGDTSPIEGYFFPLMVVYGLVGLVLGVKITRRSLLLMCPFCARAGLAYLERPEGLKMECPKCGEIRGGGLLGWKIVRDKEEVSRLKPEKAIRIMKFDSPWFWGLFGLSLVSAACGVAIHQFSGVTWFVPAVVFFLAGCVAQALSTGCLFTRGYRVSRNRQPRRYWLLMAMQGLFCIFMIYMPVGYALHKSHQLKAKAEMKTGVK